MNLIKIFKEYRNISIKSQTFPIISFFFPSHLLLHKKPPVVRLYMLLNICY